MCRRLRAAGDDTPVLMLTARDAINDRVQGLDAGADDYLVKPFALAELLARLRALLRRRPEEAGEVLRFADLSLDPVTREATAGDRPFTLTRIEFDLLELLLRHPRQVLTRELILDRVWGYTFDSGTNSLAVYVGYLRRKTEARRRAPADPHGPGCRATSSASPNRAHRADGAGRDLPDPPGAGRHAAVLVVVVLGSLATYMVAYNSLVGSVDVTLRAPRPTASTHRQRQPSVPIIQNGCGRRRARATRWCGAGGTTFNPNDPMVLPVTADGQDLGRQPGARRRTASSRPPPATASPSARSWSPCHPASPTATATPATGSSRRGGALQLTAPLTGVNHELRHLAVALWLIVLVGVALAVLLGLGVGRTVLRPLNNLTGPSRSWPRPPTSPAGSTRAAPTSSGRLRRAFNRLLAALDSSRESQRQLVLDASHELRTPLTSLRTNMEVARRMEELAPEEREVLIGDVLTQLDELTTLVADLAELARGEQPDTDAGPDPARRARPRRRSRRPPPTAGAAACTFDAEVAADLGVRVSRPHRAGRGQPARQRPQVEPGRRGGGGQLCRRDPHRPRPRAGGRRQRHRPHLRPLLPGPEARAEPGSGLGLAIVAQVARDEGGRSTPTRRRAAGPLFRFSPARPSPPPGPGVLVDGSDLTAAAGQAPRAHGAKGPGRLGCPPTWDP